MIAWNDVVNIAPELLTLPVGAQNAILAQVYEELNPEVWCSKLDLGAVWLAAHLATISKRGGAGGPVMSQTVGQVSQSYATTMSALSLLGATAYGQEYERLILTLPAARLLLV